MESPEDVFSEVTFNSRGAHGGVLSEVTTYTGGCTPGCVKVMVASPCMLVFAGAVAEYERAERREASCKVGSLACRINGGTDSKLLVVGSTLGGISSVVEGGRLLPVHSDRRRRRLGREKMLMRGKRGLRWSHQMSACAIKQTYRYALHGAIIRCKCGRLHRAASHATVVLDTQEQRVGVC